MELLQHNSLYSEVDGKLLLKFFLGRGWPGQQTPKKWQ